MKKIFIIGLFTAICLRLGAQEAKIKGLNSITKQAAKAHIGFLASDELMGREAGRPGAHIAAQYIIAQLKQYDIAPLFHHYQQPFQAYRVERQRKGRFQVHPDSIAQYKQGVHQRLELANILALIPGKNRQEYVIVGAHFDHLGIDPDLVDDTIYNGADDNASGVSAVLQLAKAFKQSGQQPQRNIIFAFWDGEEKGLLGSHYFVQSCPFLKQVKGYLNYDMIGRNSQPKDSTQVTYFYLASHPEYEQWLKEDIQRYQLPLTPTYRAWDNPIQGSDNSWFARHGIPIIWYHTGGHADYHQPSDHTEKINWNKVVAITKASFLNVWHWANDTLKE